MASRSGPGAGVFVTVTILGVLSLTLFVLTIVFASKYQSEAARASDQDQQISGFVTQAERQNDDVLRFKSFAQAERQSVLGFVMDAYDDLAGRVTGVPGDMPEVVERKLKRQNVPASQSLLQVVADRDRTVDQLKTELDQAEKARARSQADLAAEVEKGRNREQVFNETADALNDVVGRYKDDVDALRVEATDYRNQIAAHEEDLKQNYDAQVSAMRSELRERDNDIRRLQTQLEQWRSRAGGETLSPTAEYALVDGTVIGLGTAQGYIYISLGRRDKVQLGMTFAVYAQPTDIRPNASGNYPRGKAGIEVIEIDETHATCRAIPGTQLQGDPIIVGDVIANSLYDPNKVYKLVVFGSFDTNGDRIATPEEAADVENIIRQWGGQVIDELAGDVDFLVLGEKPALPIAPQTDATLVIIQAYARKKAAADRYDRLWSDALKTRIPILNMNRLYTLTGKPFGYLR